MVYRLNFARVELGSYYVELCTGHEAVVTLPGAMEEYVSFALSGMSDIRL